MPSYRIEICPNNRAGCCTAECKKEKSKITKGEIRHAVQIMFEDKLSYKYRHWGCVTPTVLHNWWEDAGHDIQLIDGLDELPEEAKQKVELALREGHVADEDWNGDIECNRFNPDKKAQGMFLKGQAKRDKEAANAEAEADSATEADMEPSPVKKKATKKRVRDAVDEDEDDEKPLKKSKAQAKKPARKTKVELSQSDDDDGDKKPVRKSKAKAKKSEPADDEVAQKPAPKKSTKQAKAKAIDNDEDDDEPIAPAKPARGKKAKQSAEDDAPQPKPARGKKAKQDADNDAPKPKAPAKRKKTAKRAQVEDEDMADELAE